ncbi:Uncharacterised protein [uncultured archaeon]|nr:Uncharacterised protein [uncultured archaeon]
MNLKSNFLCKCGGLLYTDFKTNSEYCLNKNCENHKDIERIYNKKGDVEERFKRIKESLRLKSKLFSSNFINFLFDQQNYFFSKIYGGEGAPINGLLIICYIIFLVKDIKFVGRDSRPKSFMNFLRSQHEPLNNYLFYQDIKEENIILVDLPGRTNVPLKLKYLTEINKQKNNYGMISDIHSETNFRYDNIDLEKIDKKVFKIGMELDEYFIQFFPEMMKIDMLTKSNQEFSKLFERRGFTKYEVGALLSLFFSSPVLIDLSKIKKKEFIKTLKQMEFNDIQIENLFKFLIGDSDQIPLAIVTDEEIIYGKWTSLAMVMKYLGTLPERPLIVEGKRVASKVFEGKIRDILRTRGYLVPFNQEIQLHKDEDGYDVIAIDKTKKKINIIEAKYRDLPSSAFSALNLLNLKIYGKEFGEIEIAKKQISRKEQLEQNKDILEAKLSKEGIKIDLKEYDIVPYVVFKFSPILSQFEIVKLISFDDVSNINF